MVKVQTNDDVVFNIELRHLMMSTFLRDTYNDVGGQDDITLKLPNVYSKEMLKIIEYMKQHVDDPPIVEELDPDPVKVKSSEINDPFDKEYVAIKDSELFYLVTAANYLDIPLLIVLCNKAIANMIKSQTTEQLRKRFNIVNDFTEEEEKQIQTDFSWLNK
jgi:S-phase kinase-associated protein 1